MPKLVIDPSASAYSRKKSKVIEDTAFCFRTAEAVSSPVETLAVIGAAGGMGGAGAGDAASAAAREFIESIFMRGGEVLFGHRHGVVSGDTSKLLSEVFDECNRKILASASAARKRGLMGTTLALGVIIYHAREDKTYLHVGNVGNCRGYILRGEQIFHATEEDSIAWRLYKKGEITYSELLTHPKRSVITVMGIDETMSPEIHSIELHQDDRVLFCTDGVHDPLDDEEISRVIRKSSGVHQACERLLTAASSAPGKKDQGAAALAYLSLPAPPESAGAAVSHQGARRPVRRRGDMALRTKWMIAVWSVVCLLMIGALAVYFQQPGSVWNIRSSRQPPRETLSVSGEPARELRTSPADLTRKEEATESAPAPGSSAQTKVEAAAVKKPAENEASAEMSVEWNPETERFRIKTAGASIVPLTLRYETLTFDVVPVKTMPGLYRTTRPLKQSLIGRNKTVFVSVARSARPIAVRFTETK